MSPRSAPLDAGEIAKMAALKFTPWKTGPGDWTPPTNEEWAEKVAVHFPAIRVAWLLLHKTKVELIEFVETLGEKQALETVTFLSDGEKYFKALAAISGTATARIIAAQAAVIMRDTRKPATTQKKPKPKPKVPR